MALILHDHRIVFLASLLVERTEEDYDPSTELDLCEMFWEATSGTCSVIVFGVACPLLAP